MPDTPKGLATIALLKTRLDSNEDHLTLFEPLVADALLHVSLNNFVAADVRTVVHERTGIVIPVDTLQTILNRFSRRKYLRREGGRYLVGSVGIPDPSLDKSRAEEMSSQAKLACGLLDFAREEGVTFASAEEALVALATFVSDNKVSLLLEQPLPDSPLDRSSQSRKVTRTIARFITQCCFSSEELRPVFDNLVQGILVEDALLLRDITDTSQRFADLTVVLDTPVLFAAIDLAGSANAVAIKEGLHLIREAGARTIAFDRTVAEMHRILTMYENHLATSQGRLSLFPTEITRHVLSTRMTSGDIRLISGTLEERLRRIGVQIRPLPAHDRRYTLDEQALAEALVSTKDRDTDNPRIRHDVDAIAGVLTIRAGRSSTSLERSGAIFVTTSGKVIRNAQQWYFGQGESGVPPVIHQLALTSIAWLKKPAVAPDLKIHELAAICAATLRPTRETLVKTIDTLRKLSTEGVITTDEAVAVVVSELTEPLLARLDDDVEPDADTIQDAIDRVRESYRREAQTDADTAIQAARNESELARKAANDAVLAAQSQAQVAQQFAVGALARADQIVRGVETRIDRTSSRVANSVFGGGIVVIASAALLGIPGFAEIVPAGAKFAFVGAAAIAALFGVYSSVKGGSLLSIRDSIYRKVASRLRSRWLDVAPPRPALLEPPRVLQTSEQKSLPPADGRPSN